MTLLWSDPGRVLSDRLLVRSAESMAKELSGIFTAGGIDIVWEPLAEDSVLDGSSIVVVLAPVDGSRWGLPPRTLGAVMGRGGPVACVYVFEPAVTRAIGLERRRTPGHYQQFGRALGRVAAHEIVHALVPELAHGIRGLMRAELTRSDLLGERLSMVPETSAAISAHLTAE